MEYFVLRVEPYWEKETLNWTIKRTISKRVLFNKTFDSYYTERIRRNDWLCYASDCFSLFSGFEPATQKMRMLLFQEAILQRFVGFCVKSNLIYSNLIYSKLI